VVGLRPFKLEFDSAAENIALRSLTGLGILGTGFALLGFVGQFYALWMGVLLTLGVGLAALAWRGFPMGEQERGEKKVRIFSCLFLLSVAGILAVTILKLRVPPVTADELSYHLYLPKFFLQEHAVFYLPYHVNSAFPLLTEMLYSLGVFLGSPFAIKSVHFLMGILAALTLYAIARKHFAALTAWWGAALFLTIPVVNHQMALANNDLALTAFLIGAFAALFRWEKDGETRWLCVAGLLSGFAMGVKYLALFSILIQCLLIFIGKPKGRRSIPAFFKDILAYAGPLLLISGVWYLRSYLATGNPFYPYLTSLVGGSGLQNPLGLASKGFGKDWVGWLNLPWNMTFRPQAFGGLSNQWGPLFFAFLPGLMFWKLRANRWRSVFLIVILSTVMWFYTKQNLRFLLPALPFYCLIVMGILQSLKQWGKGAHGVAQALLVCFLGLHLSIAVFQIRDDAHVGLGLETAEDYLNRRNPIYPVARFLNRRTDAVTKVLSQEHRAYDFDAEVIRERAYRRLTHYESQYKGRPEELLKKFWDEGFTHLLLKEGSAHNEPVPLLRELVRRERRAELLFESSFADAEGRRLGTYRLYKLKKNS